jgi:hypothetical protein
MLNVKKSTILLTVLSVLLIVTGCKKNSAKVEMSDLGFSMNLPSGWQLDPNDNTTFYERVKPDENWGLVAEFELEEDESLSDFIDTLLADEQEIYQQQKEMLKLMEEQTDESEFTERKIVSKINRTISSYETIVMISEADYSVIEVFIRKNDEVINVTFRTLKEDFSKYEPALNKAIESISIK